MDYIESAEKTLDICIYLLTCEDLCNSILKTFKKGVHIRVVTDCDMSLSTGSKIYELRKRGLLSSRLNIFLILFEIYFPFLFIIIIFFILFQF